MSKQKRGLGKGLGALIPQDVESVIKNEKTDQITQSIEEIDINMIKPNENQPRKVFDRDKLGNLEDSIRAHGVVQPILLTQKGNGFQIVAGERRWRAAKNVGLKSIPAVVKDLNHQAVSEIALIENLQREDLNPIEEADAYHYLIDKYTLTQEQIGKLVGKSRVYITNTLRLLKLDDSTRLMVEGGQLSSGHGRTLLGIKDEVLRKQAADRIIRDELSVRDVEKLVLKLTGETQKDAARTKSKLPEVVEIEEKLGEAFGTKITLKHGKKKGKIEIEYYGDDDLNRILKLMKYN